MSCAIPLCAPLNDFFTYTSENGANGNGKTLNRSCYNCADWSEAAPSPGII